MDKIGDRVKELRKSLGISQKAMAEQIGISAPALSDIERGVNGLSLAVFKKLVNDYGANPYFVLNGDAPLFYSEENDLVKQRLSMPKEAVERLAGSPEINALKTQLKEVQEALRKSGLMK